MSKHLTFKSHSIGNINYHLVLVTKYRKKLIDAGIEHELYSLIILYASKLSMEIIKINGLADHVHIFFRSNPSVNIASAIGKLKGYVSFTIRNTHKYLKKYKGFWQTGYFIESIGSISENIIIKYIDNQKYK